MEDTGITQTIISKVHMQMAMAIQDVKSFFDIVNDEDYYDIHDGIRYYLSCPRCGFIPKNKLDNNTKYLDCHCKCGYPVVYAQFSEMEIKLMITDHLNYLKMVDLYR